MTPTTRCPKCGGVRTPPSSTLTTAETAAVANGWNLATYRATVAGLTPAAATVMRESIPAAPSLYDRVRAAAGLPARAVPPHSETIPPAPPLADRLRSAAGAR